MEGSDTRLHAGWPTRIVYAGALLGFLPSALLGSSGWLALVLGGGVFGVFGASATLAVAALATFRAYQVLRYPAALDARPPNPLGWLLRVLGWLGMLVSGASALGLFFIKPLTLLLFRTPGDAGIAYFVVGLVLVILAGAGWLACLVFEVSRVCGPRVHAPAPAWSRRRQDMAVLVMLLVVGVGAPFLLRATAVPPCGENNLAACVSSTEGGVRRMIGLPQGEPVALESSLEEIELRPARGRQWIFQESPVVSLEASGHPVAAADARVRVRVDAVAAGQAATVTLAVNEGEEETARFVTHFPKGAKLERGSAGGMRLVVDLPSNAEPGMRSTRGGPSGKHYFLDQLFIQVREAIGSELEAREWPMRVVRPATLVESSHAASPFDVEPAAPSECKARVSIGRSAMLAYEGHLGWPLQTVTFVQSPPPQAQTLMDGNDRLVCRNADIWIVSYYARRPALRVRRFSADGKLLRFIDTAVPPTRLSGSEFEVVQASSVREEADGRVRFERWVISGKAGGNVAGKRDVFELAP